MLKALGHNLWPMLLPRRGLETKREPKLVPRVALGEAKEPNLAKANGFYKFLKALWVDMLVLSWGSSVRKLIELRFWVAQDGHLWPPKTLTIALEVRSTLGIFGHNFWPTLLPRWGLWGPEGHNLAKSNSFYMFFKSSIGATALLNFTGSKNEHPRPQFHFRGV